MSSLGAGVRRWRNVLGVLGVSALAAVACGTSAIPTIADRDVADAQTMFPDATRASLEAGRKTFILRCGACHEAYPPALRTRDEWELAVAEMSERAGLTGERQAIVLQYLSTFARR